MLKLLNYDSEFLPIFYRLLEFSHKFFINHKLSLSFLIVLKTVFKKRKKYVNNLFLNSKYQNFKILKKPFEILSINNYG